MSTSPAQLAANAANAQHSTGPRTSEGKNRSSQNASKHGLTAREVVIAPGEQEEFHHLVADCQADVKPQGAIQQTLFNQLVAAAWNLHRIRRMEAELGAGASYQDLLANEDLQHQLDRLARHHTRNERSFHRSLRELKSLQTDAALAPTLPPVLMQRVQPLASKTQIAKRTQALAIADRLNGPEEEYWSGADAEAAALRSALENHLIVSNGSTPLSQGV
jgi:hypothetical protein